MAQHATARTRTAPLHPRRVSGPLRRPVPAGGAVPRGRTGPFERLSRLPDHRVVDRLLRSRACIWVIGIMLRGIVAMQVSLLRLNAGISRAVQAQDTLVRENASLQATIAGLASGARVRAAAADENMVDPPAGDTRYLTAHPDTDAPRAAQRMRPPSVLARGVMTNGGVIPGSLAAVSATLAGATGGGTTPTAPPLPTPVATPAAVPTPAATPAAPPPPAAPTPPPVAPAAATPPPVAPAAALPTPVATAAALPPPVATAAPIQTPAPTVTTVATVAAAPQG